MSKPARSFAAFVAAFGGAALTSRDLDLPEHVIEALLAGERDGCALPRWARYLMAGYRSRRVPAVDLDLVQGALDDGMSLAEIRESFGLSEWALSDFKKSGALEWRSRRDTVDYKLVAERLADGFGVRRVAADLGIAQSTIYAAINDGIIPRGAVRRRVGDTKRHDHDEIRRLHDSGLSIKAIAASTGASATTIRGAVNGRASGGRRLEKPRRKKAQKAPPPG